MTTARTRTIYYYSVIAEILDPERNVPSSVFLQQRATSHAQAARLVGMQLNADLPTAPTFKNTRRVRVKAPQETEWRSFDVTFQHDGRYVATKPDDIPSVDYAVGLIKNLKNRWDILHNRKVFRDSEANYTAYVTAVDLILNMISSSILLGDPNNPYRIVNYDNVSLVGEVINYMPIREDGFFAAIRPDSLAIMSPNETRAHRYVSIAEAKKAIASDIKSKAGCSC